MKQIVGCILLALFSLTFFNHTAIAQSSSIRKTSYDSAKEAQLAQAKALVKTDPQAALNKVETVLLAALRDKDQEYIIKSYQTLGYINFELKQYKLAAANYQKAYDMAVAEKMKPLSDAITLPLAESYKKAGNLDKSEYYYNLLITRTDNGKSAESKVKAQSAKSEIDFMQKEYNTALESAEQVLIQSDAVPVDEQITLNNQVGVIYDTLKQPEKAARFYTKSLDIAKSNNAPRAVEAATENISNVYRKQKNTEKEIATRKDAIQYFNSNRDTVAALKQQLEITSLFANGSYSQNAEIALNQAFNYTNSNTPLTVQANLFKVAAKVKEQSGDLLEALAYYKDYSEKLALAQQEQAEQLEKELALSESVNEKLANIQFLESDMALNEKAMEVMLQNERIQRDSITTQRIIIGFLIVLILLGGATTFFLYRSVQQKKIANQLLALRSLRTQMNPHFIFNALNAVNHYISTNDELAANQYLSDFSLLMRKVLENSKFDLVPLQNELDVIEKYLKLEHARFSEKFDYKLIVSPEIDVEAFEIPPMLIQPYIENAVWHGLRYLDERKGLLQVILEELDNVLVVKIEDDGIGRKKSLEIKTNHQSQMTSTGMKNIEERLTIINDLHGSNISVAIKDLDEINSTGTAVEIHIPAIEKIKAA